MSAMDTQKLQEAADLIRNANYLTAFTGVGICVESGVPPFRGESGLWNKYDPKFLYLRVVRDLKRIFWILLRAFFLSLPCIPMNMVPIFHDS